MGLLEKSKNLLHKRKISASQGPSPISSFYQTPHPSPQATLQHQNPSEAPDPANFVTAENIRELREKIRYRYALDTEIWEQRNVPEFSRDYCKENMKKADATLEVIRKTMENWDRRELFESDVEHQKFKDIRKRLDSGKQIVWKDNPPWELVKRYSSQIRPPYEMNGQPPSSHSAQHQGPYDSIPSGKQGQRPVSDLQHISQKVLLNMPPNQRLMSPPQHIQRFTVPPQPRWG